jgi:hypothetical protein
MQTHRVLFWDAPLSGKVELEESRLLEKHINVGARHPYCAGKESRQVKFLYHTVERPSAGRSLRFGGSDVSLGITAQRSCSQGKAMNFTIITLCIQQFMDYSSQINLRESPKFYEA